MHSTSAQIWTSLVGPCHSPGQGDICVICLNCSQQRSKQMTDMHTYEWKHYLSSCLSWCNTDTHMYTYTNKWKHSLSDDKNHPKYTLNGDDILRKNILFMGQISVKPYYLRQQMSLKVYPLGEQTIISSVGAIFVIPLIEAKIVKNHILSS